MARRGNDRSSTASTMSVHDSFVQLRRTTHAPLAAAVRQRATRSKRYSVEKFQRNRLPELSPTVARSASVPPPVAHHFPEAPTDEDRAELESRMSRLTYVSGLTGVSDDGDGPPGVGGDATASPRPWRERVPQPPKRIDWGPKQLRDLIKAQEVELANMKSALDLSIEMEDAWRRRAEAGATEGQALKPPGADEALGVQKMQTLLRELQKMRDQMSTLLPHPFRGQMSTTFDDVDTGDGTPKGVIHYLMQVFKGVQHQRGLLRKRQKQLRLIREPVMAPSDEPAADPTLMTPAEEKEMEKRMKESDARAMCDIKMIGQIATLKHEVRSLKKKLEAARDAEGLAKQHEKVIESLKAQLKEWEKEGQTMMERQKIRAHEAEVQRKEVEQAVTERDAMEKELGDAPKIIEKQQKLLMKREVRIKDLEDEAQTLRMLLKGRTPARVETHLHVDSASGELEIGFGGGSEEAGHAAAAVVPVA